MTASIQKVEKGILLFTIEREAVRNAINFEVMNRLEQAIEQANVDHDVKALVITGEGTKAFCSGGDLAEFHCLQKEDEAFEMLGKMTDILYKLLTCKKLTVALINGKAVGGGCEIATACDFRVAKTSTELGFIQGKLAITTGWGGGSILLEKLPQEQAMQILLSAKRYKAEELLKIGFLQKLFDHDPIEACISFIHPYLELSTNVISAYKQLLIEKWEQSQLKERMIKEAKNCSKLWAEEEHLRIVNQFLNKS